MSKVVLVFPKRFFTEKFIESFGNKGLGVNGDQLPQYLRESVNPSKRNKGLFDSNLIYCCKSVDNNVMLVGTKCN